MTEEQRIEGAKEVRQLADNIEKQVIVPLRKLADDTEAGKLDEDEFQVQADVIEKKLDNIYWGKG